MYGNGVDFSVLVALAGLAGVDGVGNDCEVLDDEELVVVMVVVVVVLVTPNLRSRIFSSHSSHPCLGRLRLRCW